MKKILFTILGIFLIIIVLLSIIYYNYQRKLVLVDKVNSDYEPYIKNTITGSQLMTLINKVSDQNEKNKVEKDEKNRYVQNEENSVRIEIKFLESDKTYDMEAISHLGSETFVKNYNVMKFECTKTDYHENGQIKYMLFEQIEV